MAENQQMVLRTEDLVKKYRARTVVNHVSINVKQGEIVGLLGPNGAGKTTTFYMTVGLVTPNEGKIFLNDMEITKFPVYMRARNGIGYLAQEASIFRKMTVEDISKLIKIKLVSKDVTEDNTETINGDFIGVLELVAKAHFDDVNLPQDIPLLEREFAKMIYEVLYKKDEESEIEKLKSELQQALIQRNDFEALYIRYKQKYEKLTKSLNK